MVYFLTYEYQKIILGKALPARKADSLTAICEPIVYAMWHPEHLTTLWAFTALLQG
jgi:lysophospholipid acyltransferase (LPLAT)-like uncharacterized protein